MLYSAVVSGVAITAAQDLFEITAPATARAVIRDLVVGQITEAGDAAAEILGLAIIRGHTTSGSGGASVTPNNLHPWSRAAACTVERNNTTQASSGSPLTIVSDAWNIQEPYSLFERFPTLRETGIPINKSQRLVVALTAPADSVTFYATMIFEEEGIVPL